MQDAERTHTERLAKLIEDKRSCLIQLRELGGRQQRLIQDGDMGQLLTLLATKQRFLAMLQSLERDLTPFRDEDPEARTWSSPEARARCAEQAAECRQLLDELVGQERSNEALMHERRHAVADRLQQVHAQFRASGAYRMHTRQRTEQPGGPAGAAAVTPAAAPRDVHGGASAWSTTLDLSSDIR